MVVPVVTRVRIVHRHTQICDSIDFKMAMQP